MRSSLALSPIARLREVDARPTPEEAPAKAAGAHTLEKSAEALPHRKADVGRKPDGKPEGLTVQDAKNNRFHSLSCSRRAAHVNRPRKTMACPTRLFAPSVKKRRQMRPAPTGHWKTM